MNLPPWPIPPTLHVDPPQAQSPTSAPAGIAAPIPGGSPHPQTVAAPGTFQGNAITSVSVPVTIKNRPPKIRGGAPPAPPTSPSDQGQAKMGTLKSAAGMATPDAKNISGELLQEYSSLQREVRQEWESWQGLAGNLGPKIEHLQQASNNLRAVVSSVRDLHIPDVGSRCSQFTSCNECAASTICGWCTSSLRCVPGTRDGVAEPGICGTGIGDNGAYSFSSCPGMACEAYSSCEKCTRQPSCGWCHAAGSPGQCLQGSEWGPMGAAPGAPNAAVAATCPAEGPEWIHLNGKHSQC